ncbi:MAG TPA: response regulator transcription factor [Anaerolineaceae bacterium]|nr:response regulator transcription factor [Anaerolineaceae bacterium]
MIRIVVADDHLLVREGICKLLEEAGDLQVVGEADNGKDALKLTRLLHPDVLVLDISMAEMNGLETLTQVKAIEPSPQVVMLSMHADLGLVQQALQQGALGYVLKQAVAGELLAAVHAASRGSMYLSSGVSQVFSKSFFINHSENLLDRLSPREREVVELIVAGNSMREIADRLHSSIKTVEKQRRDAMRKLEVDNLASLVRTCLELGLKG